MTEQKLLPEWKLVRQESDSTGKKYLYNFRHIDGRSISIEGRVEKEAWYWLGVNTRAAQKVAAVGLPEPVAVVDDSDEGMFIDFIYGEDGNPLRRGDHLVSLDAVEQLVTGLRAELDHYKHRCGMYGLELANEVERRFKAEAERDALRAEVEQVKAINAALHNCQAVEIAKTAMDTLRTQNAELVGLLRDAALELRNPLHCVWEDDLANRLDAALSAYEGREGE